MSNPTTAQRPSSYILSQILEWDPIQEILRFASDSEVHNFRLLVLRCAYEFVFMTGTKKRHDVVRGLLEFIESPLRNIASRSGSEECIRLAMVALLDVHDIIKRSDGLWIGERLFYRGANHVVDCPLVKRLRVQLGHKYTNSFSLEDEFWS